MSDVTYCSAGCKTRNDAGELEPIQTRDGLALCESCAERLGEFLKNIRRNYPELRRHMLRVAGTADERHQTNPVPPAPLRVAILDLIDERHIQAVDGSRAVLNVRGSLGVVQRWSETVRIQRRFTYRPPAVTMDGELELLTRNYEWIVLQPWAGSMFHQLRRLNSRILDAIGIQRQKPIGRCDTVIQDDETGPRTCGGPIFMLRYTLGVVCGSCQRQYGRDELESRWPAQLIARA